MDVPGCNITTFWQPKGYRYMLLASERSERAQSCSCSIEISDMYVYTSDALE